MTERRGRRALPRVLPAALAAAVALGPGPAAPSDASALLARLLGPDETGRAAARRGILRSGERSLIPALVDALFFAPVPAREDVVACLEGLSGERLGPHYRYWVEYVGGRPEIVPHPGYRSWKASLFARIDPAFARLLDPGLPMTIRPEEIVWGGVRKDGIPALTDPKSVAAGDAAFLEDSETVFGLAIGGETRAYPQRILDWHEMANDRVGGQPVVLSYCTLCGSAIAYATARAEGGRLLFGSSGLLYRSNKLMYDEGTLSLWSNLTGEPVAGALAERGISLPMLPLTVTTWRDWKARHPNTTVVSRETGHRRNYAPGAAYGKYFDSPETMFPVWKRDGSLEAKAWVFALRAGGAARAYPLDLLMRERVVNDRVGGVAVALVADPETGAVRAYRRGDREFAEGPSSTLIEPADATVWRVEESALRPVDRGAPRLTRVPGHRAYWFGWYAFFPDTTLYAGCDGAAP